MKKSLFLFLSLLSLVVLFTSVAAAPAEVRLLKLVSIEHWFNKGVVFKFQVTGKFSQEELKGFVNISDREFGLDCSFDDYGFLTCVGGDALDQFVGRQGLVVVAGQGFYVIIPPRYIFTPPSQGGPAPVSGPVEYCYDLYSQDGDWFPTGDSVCQDTPGNNGDELVILPEDLYIFDNGVGPCDTSGLQGYFRFCSAPK